MWPWLVLLRQQCNRLCTSCFVNYVMLSHNTANWRQSNRTRIFRTVRVCAKLLFTTPGLFLHKICWTEKIYRSFLQLYSQTVRVKLPSTASKSSCYHHHKTTEVTATTSSVAVESVLGCWRRLQDSASTSVYWT